MGRRGQGNRGPTDQMDGRGGEEHKTTPEISSCNQQEDGRHPPEEVEDGFQRWGCGVLGSALMCPGGEHWV